MMQYHFIFYISIQFLVSFFQRLFHFINVNALFYYPYLSCIFTAYFIHLLFKIILFTFDIELNLYFNIVTLLMIITWCFIIDLYWCVMYPIKKIVKYVYEYTINFGHIGMENHEYLMQPIVIGYKNNDPTFPILFNGIAFMQDKFYFLRHFFLPFFALRYFIIKEPWAFSFIHIFVIMNYLTDYNLYYTYMYLIILHISRFLFYMSDYDFKYKHYILAWINISEQITNKEIIYEKAKINKIIPKFSISNLYMLMYVSFRSEIQGAAFSIAPFYRPHPHFWKGTYNFSWSLKFFGIYNSLFEFILILQPHIITQMLYFHYRNLFYWVILIMLFIYFDVFICNILLVVL